MTLRELAQIYAPKVGTDARAYTFVFPNRRAGLFFRKYLSEAVGKTMFAPRLLTINECFHSLSNSRVPDQMDLLFRLYQSYCKIQTSPEPFDSFLYWGKMMLGDYNDVDNHLTEHIEVLFSTIRDTHILSSEFSFLTEAQKRALTEFWGDFQESEARHTLRERETHVDEKDNPHSRFLYVWELLYPVYEQYKRDLQEAGLAYEGMLHREVVEHFDEIEESKFAGQYVFAGFHIRSASEERLMTLMQKRGIADVHVDEEDDYLSKEHYPLPKDIHWVRVPSDVGQCTEVHRILTAIEPTEYEQTCVVLPEEKLLLPLLHTLPEQAKRVNVTMGYPLASTGVYALMEMLFALQKNKRISKGTDVRESEDVQESERDTVSFYHADVTRILRSTFVRQLALQAANEIETRMVEEHMLYVRHDEIPQDELLQLIFAEVAVGEINEACRNINSKDDETYRNINGEDGERCRSIDNEAIAMCRYTDNVLTYIGERVKEQAEAVYQMTKAIRRLMRLLGEHPEIARTMEQKTLYAVMRQLIGDISIPYAGEPLGGLQIMGVLETRGLSFKNLIITDFNDDIYPGKSRGSSYIPYLLRSAFGLPLPERQDRIFAHNFYSMLSGAEHVWLITNSRADDQHSGEPSRYLMQLRYLREADIQEHVVPSIPLKKAIPLGAIEKTPEVVKMLREWGLGSGFSPSALTDWLRCPKKFYFSRVLRLRESAELTDDVAANEFGTCVHAVMQHLYPLREMQTKEQLKDLARKDILRMRVLRLLAQAEKDKEQWKLAQELRPLHDPLALEAVLRHVRAIIEHDANYSAPFQVLSMEEKYSGHVKVGEETYHVSGKIDRVDKRGNIVRVIDYKTGKPTIDYDEAKLFEPDKEHPHEAFQTLCYCLMYSSHLNEGEVLEPHLFAARHFSKGETPQTKVRPKKNPDSTWETEKDSFEEQLGDLIRNMVDEQVPFAPIYDKRQCEYCPFLTYCQ